MGEAEEKLFKIGTNRSKHARNRSKCLPQPRYVTEFEHRHASWIKSQLHTKACIFLQKSETNAGRTGSMKRQSSMSDPENSTQLLRAGRVLDWSNPRLDRFELADRTGKDREAG